jgi:hypothetical protein
MLGLGIGFMKKGVLESFVFFFLYVEENEKLLDSDMDSNERRELLMVRF